MLPIQLIAAAVGTYGRVLLSGETISAGAASPGAATAGIRFNTDGTVDNYVNGVYTQIDSATDWIIPNGAASADFDVRFTGLTGDAFTTEAAAEDTWINLGSNRTWLLTQSGGGVKSNTSTFEIRLGGSTLASASYTINATVI